MKQLNNNTFKKNSYNCYWKKLCFIEEHLGKNSWSHHCFQSLAPSSTSPDNSIQKNIKNPPTVTAYSLIQTKFRGKKERERETERWSDKYVCRESDKNSATSTFFNFVFAAQYKI